MALQLAQDGLYFRFGGVELGNCGADSLPGIAGLSIEVELAVPAWQGLGQKLKMLEGCSSPNSSSCPC